MSYDLGLCSMCERAPATVERRSTNLEAAFCVECDRDLHGAHARVMERRAWIEGSWTKEGRPILPEPRPDFVWIWIEGNHQAFQEGLEVTRGCSMHVLLLASAFCFRAREGRDPRWFWRRIDAVRLPDLDR